MGKVVKGEFSSVNGSDVRIVRDGSGRILGTITKTKAGYRVTRIDGKSREKRYLSDAFKSISRAN